MTNRQIYLADVTPVTDLSFEPLAPRYQSARFAGVSIVYILMMGLALLLLLTDHPRLCFIAEGMIAIAFAANLLLLPKSCRFKGYAFREHDVNYRSGVIFPTITTIPYSRIQQVSLKLNPVSRLFGLYSLEVVNGAQGMSSLTIPGLTEERAMQIKNFVTDKIRG